MNHIIVYLDGLGAALLLFSSFILLLRWRNTHWFDGILIVLLFSMILFFLSNFFEWMGLFTFIDPYGGFLLPLTWSFFFFADINKIKINELKRAQNSLKETEERLRLFIENAPIALAMFDCEMRYLSASRRWLIDSGFTTKNIIQQSHYVLFPQTPDRWKNVYHRGLTGEVMRAEEDRFTRDDGTVQWLRWEVRPWFSSAGNVGGIIVFKEDITERKQSEIALRQSEERFRKVFENAATGITITDWEGRFLYSNPAFCAMLGYTEEEYKKLVFPSIVYKDDWAAHQAQIRRLYSGELSYFEIENRCIHKDGHSVLTNNYISILTDESGKPAYLLGLLTDITERKKIEEALRVSEANFRSYFENLAVGTAQINNKGHFIRVNDRYCAITGYSREELLGGMSPQDLDHPDERDADSEHIAKFFRGEAPYNVEKRYIRKDGKIVWVHVTVAVIRNPDGTICFTAAVIEDITERKRAQEALTAEKEWLSVTLRSIGDGVITTDTDNKIISINKAGENLLGWTQEEASGKVLEEFFNFENESTHQKLPISGMNFKLSENVRIITRDGRKLEIADSYEPIIDNSGKTQGGVLVFHDITERCKYELNLKSSLHQKEVLLQELYHRTKNNMQVISALLELQAASTDNDEVERIVRDSKTRIRTMALAHERLYSSKSLSEINIREYILELSQLLMASYDISPQRVKVVYNIADINLLIDIAMPCGLVISELISNAFKYAFPKVMTGQIDISLKAVKPNQIELIIGDNGVGVPKDFDITKSTTLGVQLVFSIVQFQLRGSARVESDGGVRWYINFRNDIYSERV